MVIDRPAARLKLILLSMPKTAQALLMKRCKC
jgi:hypothetical protein